MCIISVTAMSTATAMSPPLPSTSTFSFTAPFPSPLKQRRVSLALPQSRQTPAWNFRDDTGLDLHSNTDTPTSSSLNAGDTRGGEDDASAPPEKKQRNKWSAAETDTLVLGCQKVRSLRVYLFATVLIPHSMHSGE